MATLGSGSGRIVFSPEPLENVMISDNLTTAAMVVTVTEAPYNDEESENRINVTENLMNNKTENIFSSNSSHLTTSDNNLEVNQVALKFQKVKNLYQILI